LAEINEKKQKIIGLQNDLKDFEKEYEVVNDKYKNNNS